MDFLDIFRTKGTQLAWQRLSGDNVIGRSTGEEIEAEGAYAVLRLAEMYLGTTRVLWRKRSALLHAYVNAGNGHEQHMVAGPGQLQNLSERNLDRVLVLNYRLAGPIPYRGDDLSLLTGLYSVPREDTSAALVETVGTLAGLAGGGAAAGTEIARIVKSGVECILGLAQTELRLGVSDTFPAGQPLSTGVLVGVSAPAANVDFTRLWLDDGHLKVGSTPGLAQPYEEADYFVIMVERLERRPDWSGLPGLEGFEARFKGILSSGKDRAGLHADLAGVWPPFREALVTSPHLTRHDAELIADEVAADLTARVESIVTQNPFETRSFRDVPAERMDPHDVDFALIDVGGTSSGGATPTFLDGGA
jgi:hypothetical protein